MNVMCLNHLETVPLALVHGKIVFRETGPWCQKRMRTATEHSFLPFFLPSLKTRKSILYLPVIVNL